MRIRVILLASRQPVADHGSSGFTDAPHPQNFATMGAILCRRAPRDRARGMPRTARIQIQRLCRLGAAGPHFARFRGFRARPVHHRRQGFGQGGDRALSRAARRRSLHHALPVAGAAAGASAELDPAPRRDFRVVDIGPAWWWWSRQGSNNPRRQSRVRGSSMAKVRCSVGCGVVVIRLTPSGASKRCHFPCGTTTTIPALSV